MIPTIVVKPNATFDEYASCLNAPFDSPSPVALAVIKIAAIVFSTTLTVTLIETWGTLVSWVALALTATFLAIFFAARASANKRLRACFEAAKSDPATYTFAEANVIGTCECTRAEMSWTAFERFIEKGELLLLICKSRACIYIPKRDVPPERLDDLKALLEDRIAGRL